jgi:hypothetical protein
MKKTKKVPNINLFFIYQPRGSRYRRFGIALELSADCVVDGGTASLVLLCSIGATVLVSSLFRSGCVGIKLCPVLICDWSGTP